MNFVIDKSDLRQSPERIDVERIIDRAKGKTGIESDRAFSRQLGKAHNYVQLIRSGSIQPAPDVLAEIMRLAGYGDEGIASTVLTFMASNYEGYSRALLLKCARTLGALVCMFVLCSGVFSAPADARTTDANSVANVYYG